MALSRKILALLVLLACSFCGLRAQEQAQDSVFKLVQADLARQVEVYGTHYRIVQGNARFFHNDTYFLCDSACWNVEAQQVFAYGNVQVIQDGTFLKSERMNYDASDNTARFRGSLVELFDKDGNTLRTEWLDYNTKDSIAVFQGGGAMMNRDSSAVASESGRYEAKERMFHFYDKVEVYVDSIVISTDRMDYNSGEDRVYFYDNTKMWKDKGFVKARYGWYDRPTEKIHFAKDVYIDDPEYEAWAQEVYYDQRTGNAEMFDNAQILDTARISYYTADHIVYENDSIAGRVTMSRDPVIIYCGKNDSGQPDTLYVRADSLFVYSKYKCDIPEDEIKEAAQRVEDIMFDALQKKREEQAAERAKAAEEALRQAGKLPPAGAADSTSRAKAPGEGFVGKKNSGPLADKMHAAGKEAAGQETAEAPPAAPPAPADTLAAAPLDTIPSAPDSTAIRYIHAYRNMRAFRSDLQACCDSMVFCELDSIARMFGRPILWNDIKNQLTSETMQMMFKDGNAFRGSMVTDSWLVSQVDSTYYNQIKSTEMIGYFYDNELYRYDALGGVNALFFLQDGEYITTANLKEAKTLSAMIKNGNARRLLYTEQIKSDAFPVLEFPKEKLYLKNFEWRGHERPTCIDDITSRRPITSKRSEYSYLDLPRFSEVERFFQGAMESRMPYIEGIESDRRLREDERQMHLQ